MRKLLPIFAIAVFSLGCQATPQTAPPAASPGSESVHVVYLLRHAEKRLPEDGGDPRDPELTDAGATRAADLARVLAPAEVARVFSTDYKRTRDTVEPLAAALGLQVQIYDPRALEPFARELREMSGRSVVVGHSNTTPALVELLGGDGGEPTDEPAEYDRLYVLVLQPGRPVTTVQLRFGEGR